MKIVQRSWFFSVDQAWVDLHDISTNDFSLQENPGERARLSQWTAYTLTISLMKFAYAHGFQREL